MSARGLLVNPALFAGEPRTPPEAITRFVDHAMSWGLPTSFLQYVGSTNHHSRHLAYMLEDRMPSRAESIYFNSLASPASILDWLADAGYV